MPEKIKLTNCEISDERRVVGDRFETYTVRTRLRGFHATHPEFKGHIVLQDFYIFSFFESANSDEEMLIEGFITTELSLGDTKYKNAFPYFVSICGKRMHHRSVWCNIQFQVEDPVSEEFKLLIEFYFNEEGKKRQKVGEHEVVVFVPKKVTAKV